MSLGIGEGGAGLGPKRTAGSGEARIRKRIPRNAPGLWNLGAKEINILFYDRRLSRADTYGNGIDSPAEEWLPPGLNSLLAAQAIFPLAAQFEMAGYPKENEVAGAIHDRIDAGWPILAKRVRIIPEYGQAFVDAFDHIDAPEDVTIAEIANALTAFMAIEWQSTDSPFDAFLAGDTGALDLRQRRGMDLFFGKAGCSACHSGPLLSDQDFRALAALRPRTHTALRSDDPRRYAASACGTGTHHPTPSEPRTGAVRLDTGHGRPARRTMAAGYRLRGLGRHPRTRPSGDGTRHNAG